MCPIQYHHIKCCYKKNIFFLIGLIMTAITTSPFTDKVQITQTSMILSVGMKEARPSGLNISDLISIGFMKEYLQLCS